MTTVTLTNDFHHTDVTLRVPESGILSESQVRRARRELCGIEGCTCGGNLSERGRQTVEIETTHDSPRTWRIAPKQDS